MPPLPLFSAGKNGTLFTDNDGDGFVSPGDVLLYTIVVSNISRAPVPNVPVQDTLPPDTTYVPNSTTFKNASNVMTPIPDDGSGTAFPLDGAGKVLDSVTPLPVGGTYEVTFKVTIDTFPNLTPGTTELVNVCSVTASGLTVPCQDTTTLFGCIGDFVWNDLDADTVQDGGAETGIGSVTLNLYVDLNGNGSIDGCDAVVATPGDQWRRYLPLLRARSRELHRRRGERVGARRVRAHHRERPEGHHDRRRPVQPDRRLRVPHPADADPDRDRDGDPDADADRHADGDTDGDADGHRDPDRHRDAH